MIDRKQYIDGILERIRSISLNSGGIDEVDKIRLSANVGVLVAETVEKNAEATGVLTATLILFGSAMKKAGDESAELAKALTRYTGIPAFATIWLVVVTGMLVYVEWRKPEPQSQAVPAGTASAWPVGIH